MGCSWNTSSNTFECCRENVYFQVLPITWIEPIEKVSRVELVPWGTSKTLFYAHISITAGLNNFFNIRYLVGYIFLFEIENCIIFVPYIFSKKKTNFRGDIIRRKTFQPLFTVLVNNILCPKASCLKPFDLKHREKALLDGG